MEPAQKDELLSRLESLPGKISCYYKDLVDGDSFSYNSAEPMHAASIIKLFIMVEAFRRFEAGSLDPKQKVAIRDHDRVPSCGALTYLHDGIEVTVIDLATLMIILSDNTATNVLIDLLGFAAINTTIHRLGYSETGLLRKMYDTEKSAKGIQNLITAEEAGDLLERLHRGEIVSVQASAQMLAILANQRLNSKLPFYLKPMQPTPKIAHKTGEDTGITHDVGVVYPPAGHPFVLCFLGNGTDVCRFERFMSDSTLEIYLAGEERGFDDENRQN